MYFLIKIIKEKIVQYRIERRFYQHNVLKCSYAQSLFLLANGLSFFLLISSSSGEERIVDPMLAKRVDRRPLDSERSESLTLG